MAGTGRWTRRGLAILLALALIGVLWLVVATPDGRRSVNAGPRATEPVAVPTPRRRPLASDKPTSPVEPAGPTGSVPLRFAVTRDDAPVPECGVLLWHGERVVGSGLTDGEGACSIIVPSQLDLRAFVAVSDAAPAIVPVRGADAVQVIQLDSRPALAGYLLVDGAPSARSIAVTFSAPVPLPPLWERRRREIRRALAALGADEAPGGIGLDRLAARTGAGGFFTFCDLPDSWFGGLSLPGELEMDPRWRPVTAPDTGIILRATTARLIRGRVVFADGRPAAGARVAARVEVERGSSLLRVETDGDGSFAIRIPREVTGAAEIVASYGGVDVSRACELLPGDLDLEALVLPVCRSLEVTVVDSRGDPVAGAELRAWNGLRSRTPLRYRDYHRLGAPADATGMIRIPAVSPHAVDVAVVAPGHARREVTLDGGVSRATIELTRCNRLLIRRPAADRRQLVLLLEAQSGDLQEHRTAPLAYGSTGDEIRASGSGSEARLEFHDDVAFQQLRPTALTLRVLDAVSAVVLERSIDPLGADEWREVRLDLPEGHREVALGGRVTWSTGAPLAGAVVQLNRGSGTRTGVDGAFDLGLASQDGLPDDNELRVFHPAGGEHLLRFTRDALVALGDRVEVVLEEPRAVLVRVEGGRVDRVWLVGDRPQTSCPLTPLGVDEVRVLLPPGTAGGQLLVAVRGRSYEVVLHRDVDRYEITVDPPGEIVLELDVDTSFDRVVIRARSGETAPLAGGGKPAPDGRATVSFEVAAARPYSFRAYGRRREPAAGDDRWIELGGLDDVVVRPAETRRLPWRLVP